MAEERIDIQITDSGAEKAAKNLREIAAQARKTGDYVERLKASLASLPSSRVTSVTGGGAAGRVADDTAAARNATQLARAKDAAAAASRRHAAALLIETTQTQRLAEATARATRAQNARSSAGVGAGAGVSGLDGASAAAAALEARLNALATAASKADANLERLAAAGRQTQDSLNGAASSARASASSMNQISGTSRTYATNMNNVAGATGLAGHQMGNLVAQLNDIGVSLASGQNPLLVLIQQGSQIQGLAMTVEGGFRTLIAATAALVIGQQQVSNAATQAAVANTANANAALAAAEAQALQAGIAANLVIAEQAVTVAQAEAGGAAARLAVAQANLATATAAVRNAAVPTTQQLTAMAAAEAAVARNAQAATIASAELATANARLAAATATAAAQQERLALASAGTRLGLGPVGAAIVGLSAVLVPAAVALKRFNDEINRNNGLDEYVRQLGLTNKEIKELEDVTVTYGDMALGTWMTVKEGLAGLGPVFDAISAVVMGAIDLIWQTLKNFSFGLVALFKGTYRAVVTIWNNFPKAFGDIFVSAVNLAIGLLEGVANAAVDVFNALGLSFERVTLRRMVNSNAGAAAQLGADIAGGYTDAFREAEAGYDRFAQRVSDNSRKAARDRIKGQATAIIEDRTGGASGGSRKTGEDEAAKAAEKRAAALSQVNLQLDNELSRMRLLRDERAIEQRMDQIAESFAQKKIKLTEAEAAAIRAKVVEIERFKVVQQELDRITEEALGPERTLNAVREASKILLDQGAISLERYGQELAKAQRLYNEATDPLFRFNEELAAAERTMGLYGDALEQANYLETVRQALVAQGYEGDALKAKLLSAEVQDLLARNQALMDEAFIRSQMGAILNPIMDQQREIDAKALLYAELDRLRNEDLIREGAYQQARAALWVKYNEMKLANTADFFGTLASITSKGHGAVAAISKAAAVAEATIQGYLAVQKALASLPPPWNFAAAAAVAVKTGAQVAGILSTNVGSFATGGQFMVQGRGGVDQNNINMNVSRGERVTIETPQQQRANDNSTSAAPVVNVKSIVQFDPANMIDALNTAQGEQVVMTIVERKSSEIKQLLGS